MPIFPTIADPYDPNEVYYGIEQLRALYVFLKEESLEDHDIAIIDQKIEDAMANLASILSLYDNQWGGY